MTVNCCFGLHRFTLSLTYPIFLYKESHCISALFAVMTNLSLLISIIFFTNANYVSFYQDYLIANDNSAMVTDFCRIPKLSRLCVFQFPPDLGACSKDNSQEKHIFADREISKISGILFGSRIIVEKFTANNYKWHNRGLTLSTGITTRFYLVLSCKTKAFFFLFSEFLMIRCMWRMLFS